MGRMKQRGCSEPDTMVAPHEPPHPHPASDKESGVGHSNIPDVDAFGSLRTQKDIFKLQFNLESQMLRLCRPAFMSLVKPSGFWPAHLGAPAQPSAI